MYKLAGKACIGSRGAGGLWRERLWRGAALAFACCGLGGNVLHAQIAATAPDAVVSDRSTWAQEARDPHLLSRHFGVGDPDPAGRREDIARRFALYKQAKIGVLRIDFDWRGLEAAEGHWRESPILAFMQLARSEGFRLKATVGAMPAPPRWFFDAHPDAELVNADGLRSANVVSYWYPGLHALLEQKEERLFAYLKAQDLLDVITYVIVPFGPAPEPIYPAPWTTGASADAPKFWFYDSHTQQDFARAMRRKYLGVARADAAWGTSFSEWSQVKPPTPGTHPGAMWRDVLEWYRDAKRDFTIWQMGHYRDLIARYWPTGRRPPLLLLAPGTHTEEAEWAEAIRTGDGNGRIELQLDSEFILCLAHRFDAYLQYTALPNAEEVRYLEGYMRAKNCEAPMWGENVGNVGDPKELRAEILTERLFGGEYIGSNLFEPDRVTASPWLVGLKATNINLLYRNIGRDD